MLGQELDGEEAVRGALEGLFVAFGDFRFEETRKYFADDAIILYGKFSATHAGEYAGIPPTGRHVESPVVAIYDFDEDRLLNETVLFDNGDVIGQITGE